MLINHCHVAAKGFGPESQTNSEIGTLPKLKSIMDTLGVDRAVTFARRDRRRSPCAPG